ncbi:MAG: ABC transporter permease, partial [Pirellulaceae bacterium]
MKLTRLVHRSLVFHRRMHLAVALGVAAATAVLTGALLVGDSVRGSLRSLTLERLGRIDEVILQDRFFREQLVDELQSSAEFPARYAQAEPAILFPHATIERRTDGGTLRGSSVLVLGCSAGFWDLDESGVRPEPMPGENEVVLNATLAEELRARVGDTVTLRLPQSNEVPADSPLASKNDRVRGVPGLRVVAIVPASGLGQFSLQPSQRPPANAFVAIATLQAALDEEHGINAVFLSRREGHDAPADGLPDWLQPQLQDFGVAVTHVRRGPGPPTAPDPVSIDYYSVTTDRMVFSPATADVIAGVVRPWGGQPLLTYLANSIRAVGTSTPSTQASHGIPYSMVTAIDPGEQFPLVDPSGARIGPIADDEIVLNAWAAQDLGGQPGGTIAVDYFEPETAHGQAVERTAQLRWKAVAALTRPARPYRPRRPAEYDQPLTPANDPDLTPTVEGVTDQDTIADWDAPFPFDYDRVREADDEYWETYRTTPKAFVSYATGVRLWGSRFGQVTSFRVPAGGRSLEELESSLARELARHAAEVGFQWIPIRERQLAASAGTTPFDVLFLSLSFFVIAAALLMVSLLFRLGIDMRASEVGTLLALGLPRRQVRGLCLREGCVVAAGGAAL